MRRTTLRLVLETVDEHPHGSIVRSSVRSSAVLDKGTSLDEAVEVARMGLEDELRARRAPGRKR